MGRDDLQGAFMAGEKILVADDSTHIRMMVRGALEGRGYVIVEAVDGADALQKAIDAQPDLVLLDLTMPELDGFEVLQFMKSRPDTTDIKVMMLTGSAETSNQQYGYTLGAIGYIVKPFATEQLQTAVDRALSSPW
jgi:CheY-like chemotaxis protein